MQNQARKIRRTANACVSCRQSKIKCSGEDPCSNCQRRFVKCRFEQGVAKVTVPERYLYNLQKQIRNQQFSAGTKRAPEELAEDGCDPDDDSRLRTLQMIPDRIVGDVPRIWTSPFAQSSITNKSIYKNKRNWIWLAPSSAWSFTARLTLMMTEKLNIESDRTSPIFLANDIYHVNWGPPPATDSTPDVSGLPSIDHALYLFDTVKFHLGQHYRLFDEKDFIKNMQEFYFGTPSEKATECRLWYVQFLIMLAFAKAFLAQSKGKEDPPGSNFFIRAMSLMPDITMLWKDSLLAIEVLALASLYLYSVDRRESAHVYVCQAIRIAQMEGLHTQLPEDELGTDLVVRCRHLWWTLYNLDRHFSSSLGVPMSTQDSDITTILDTPNHCSQQDSTLGLQVKLSRLLESILTKIYKNEETQLATFLDTTKSILQSMAGYAQEIENIIEMKFKSSVDAMSKETRHITLLYHQCVIVATRPLLLSVLKERLDKLGQAEEDFQSFLALTKPLITTGIKSAVKTLQILSAEDCLLEAFLPFDLEFTYGAAIHLAMAKALFPHTDEEVAYNDQVQCLLDEMIVKGNRVAGVRKAELSHLEFLFGELAKRVESLGVLTLTLVTPECLNTDLTNELADGPDYEAVQDGDHYRIPYGPQLPVMDGGDSQLSSHMQQPAFSNSEMLDTIGISSYEFLSIVDQMGHMDGMV